GRLDEMHRWPAALVLRPCEEVADRLLQLLESDLHRRNGVRDAGTEPEPATESEPAIFTPEFVDRTWHISRASLSPQQAAHHDLGQVTEAGGSEQCVLYRAHDGDGEHPDRGEQLRESLCPR